MIRNKPHHLAKIKNYVERLESGEPFTVARYGDGEWGAVLGKVTLTTYGDVVTPLLGRAIARTLIESKPYYYASLGEPWSDEVDAWCRENGVQVRWAKKDVLERSIQDDTFGDVLRVLIRKNVLVVGLPRLKALEEMFGFRHLSVDGPNCFIRREPIEVEIWDACEQNQPDVILMACGLATVVMIHELHSTLGATLLDVGSIFDPFVGFESRRGHRTDRHRKMVERVKTAGRK